ncbi:MAG: hypothetical protein Q7R60_03245 [bacterium]|nr:hypothetical protein [bacterium]
MQNHTGIFIVLEGSDGSGKGTQFRLLSERLKAVGHEVAVFDFPRYEEPSSHFVKRYLNGDFGPASEVSPYTASFFFALDRYEAAPQIKKALDAGKVVIANRYVGSNMAHQGTKFSSLAEQRGFFMWAESLEYQLLGIPRPNISLFLKVPANISFELIAQKTERNYTKKKRDEHEDDIQHLEKAVTAYEILCQLFPRDFTEINCTADGQILSIVQINDLIWETITPLLPQPKRKGKAIFLSLDQATEFNGSKNKTATNDKPALGDSDAKFKSILNLQKQMLTKSGSAKGVNQQQLKSAINLLMPLHYRKSELKQLLKKDVDEKLSTEDEPVAVNEIIEKLAESIPILTANEPIKLLIANPWNEFQVLDEAKSAGLDYRKKEQALSVKLKTAASSISYLFEATSDWVTLLAFKNEIKAREIIVLATSPKLGYVVPGIIESVNLEESFNKAFSLSAKHYSQMTKNKDKDAVYALLLGHNVRWKFEIDASTLAIALKSSKSKNLLSFLDLLKQKIAEHHPHVARIL